MNILYESKYIYEQHNHFIPILPIMDIVYYHSISTFKFMSTLRQGMVIMSYSIYIPFCSNIGSRDNMSRVSN